MKNPELLSKELLARICMKSVEMNEKVDAASKILRVAEKTLVENGVGLEVWLSDSDTAAEFTIGFTKAWGYWCIAKKDKFAGKPKALKDCGKLDRIRGAAYLPELLEKISLHIDIILESH